MSSAELGSLWITSTGNLHELASRPIVAKKPYLYKIFLPGCGGDWLARSSLTIDFAVAAGYKKKYSRCLPVLAPVFAGLSPGFRQLMKIKPEQLDRMAAMLIASYRDKELMAATADDAAIKGKIAEVIAKNFAEEEAIEEEARRMLASHARVARDMDSIKMFQLAKQKLAAKKGFIL
jgi:hypothetical protein